MKRAIPIGPVDAAAIKTSGGKVRLRLLFTIDQLAALMDAARNGDIDDDTEDVKRTVTQRNAPESEKRRSEDDDGGDARATRVFVIEGTRAWEAWMAFKKRTTRREWTLTTVRVVEGKKRTGWWFDSLFPPDQPELTGSTGPPTSPSQLSEEDEQELAQGLK